MPEPYPARPAPRGEPWPLSAATTQVLRQPRVASGIVLQLALKELVIAGAWQLRRPPKSAWWRSAKVQLVDGPTTAPTVPPLPMLDRALRDLAPAGGDLQALVRDLVKRRPHLADQLRDAARAELLELGLLEAVEHRWLPTGWQARPAAARLKADLAERERSLAGALPRGGPAAVGAVQRLEESPALALLLGRKQLKAVDAAVREARLCGVEVHLLIGSDGGDLTSLSDLCDVSGAVDACVDGGGGDGGDGGGGD